jgi:transitional endoplasmic reticulum ATPase
MNDQTLKLLEKALQISQGDWETRAHLVESYLARGQAQAAAEILRAAPEIPAAEAAQLLKAQVELEVAPSDAIVTLESVLARNKACARAYLLLARVYRKRGLRDEARRKYGAATVIDESLVDPDLAAWIDGKAPAVTPAPLLASDDFVPAGDEEPAGLISAHAPNASALSPDLLAISDPLEGTKRLTFDDVGGMEDVIERIRMNIIYPFKNPEVFRKFNKRPGGGILLYGPPGCGKTHLARATAGECGAKFISIAITDILSKWIGESERHLHEIFETARRHAPAVIFIDEIDAIGMNRSDAGAYQAPIVNVLLTEMDGIQASNESLMVLAATNVPWRVDSALRRPGRFDRVLFVPPPDLGAREAILKIHLRGLPAAQVDLAKLAQKANLFSGADLRAAVERASEKAIYQEMRTGRGTELTQATLLEAIKETKPSTVEWLETARSYATYANRAGLYDDLVAFFEK